MIQYLDHDDFKKSRKAVIITSVAILVISTFNLTSNKLKVFGLETTFDIANLVSMLKIGLLYFLVVFAFHAITEVFSLYKNIRLNNLKGKTPDPELTKIIEEQVKFALDIQQEKSPEREKVIHEKTQEIYFRVERTLKLITKMISSLEIQYFLVIQAFVPLFLGFVAMNEPSALQTYLQP